MSLRAGVLAGTLALGAVPLAGGVDEPSEAWRSFEGTWSASGRRAAVTVEGGGAAAIVEISGAVVLTDRDVLGRGFRGQAIGFDDGQGLSVGRCVWTDEKGDQVFSRLKGGPVRTGKQVSGTITGGTGRYVGLEGEYSFTWQFVVAAEDGGGLIQGRTVGLSGRVRGGGVAK